jgi:hypothetical protein
VDAWLSFGNGGMGYFVRASTGCRVANSSRKDDTLYALWQIVLERMTLYMPSGE